MQLRIHNEGWVYFVISCMITIILIPFYTILGILLCISSIYIFYFFRDPIRAIPNENMVVSPADGVVTFIGNSKNPLDENLDKNIYTKISIFLSIFDVHVNRMPVDATVSLIKYVPGKFINATLDKSSTENERNIIFAENNKDKFYIVQIAGLIARRIVTEVYKNQELNQGSKIGMIRFGSRADIYFENYASLVKVNQKTFAGETLLARK